MKKEPLSNEEAERLDQLADEFYRALHSQARRDEPPQLSTQSKGVSLAKGCIRYPKPEKTDFHMVEMMLKATHESTGVSS